MVTVTHIRRSALLLSLIFIIVSCKLTLVPQYSADLDDQIANTAKANDKLYIDILDASASARVYDNFKDRYNEIESDINSIELKNEARPKNADFLIIIKNLKNGFAEAKKYHKDHNTLSDGEAMAYQATIAGYWKPLYVAEKALKTAN